MQGRIGFFLLAGCLALGACGGEEAEEVEEVEEVEVSDDETDPGHEDDDLIHEEGETDEEHAVHDTHPRPDDGELFVESEELILDDETRARVAPERRGLAHILIRYRGAERAEGVSRSKSDAETLAQQVLARAQDEDEDFGALAAELSDDSANKDHGGDMGALEQGLLPEALDEALFAMEVGEVRGPIESPLGYHVLTRTR